MTSIISRVAKLFDRFICSTFIRCFHRFWFLNALGIFFCVWYFDKFGFVDFGFENIKIRKSLCLICLVYLHTLLSHDQ